MVVAVAATTSRAAVAPAESDELWWSGGEKNLHFLSRKVNIDKEIGDPFSEASDCRYNGQEKLHNMARRKRANDTQNNALIETGSHHHYHEHHLNHYQYQYQYQYHFHTVEHAGSNNSNSYSNSSSNSNKNNHKRQITTRRSIPKTVQNRMYQITSQQFKNGQHSRKARHRNHLHHQQQQQLIQYILNLLKTILVLILIAQTRLSFDGGGFTGRGYGKAITGVSCTSVLTRSTGQTSGDSSERGVVVVVDQSGQHDGQHSSSQLLVDGDKFDLYSSRPAAKGWLPVFSVTDDDDDEVTSDHRHQLNKRRQRKRSSEDQNDHDGQVRVVTSLPSILGKLGRLKRDRFNGSDNDSDDGGHNAASDTINTLTETNSTLSMDGNDQQQAMQANNSQADHNRQVATSGNSSTGPLSTTSSLHQERSIMGPAAPAYKWPVLGLVGLMFIGATGNILVCMAVLRERRLQTATNYFLLSLAVADLLVCTLVMPFGIIYEFYGRWPYDWRICNLWVTCDVLTCSSSILHMCFISVGRYLGIRNPLHARQANLFVSRRAVLWRIAIAWASSALIASPITMMSLYDHKNIVPSPTECAISNKYFMIFGSLLAFFIPMFVMVPSYVMTVKLLSRRAKFVRNDSILLANQQSQAAASSAAGLLANGGGGAGGGASILDDPTTAASYADTTTGLYDTGGSISSAARFAESARQRRRATAAAAANAARQCRIRSSMDELASSSSLKGGAAGTGRAGAGAATGHQLLAPPKTRRSQRRDFWSGLISESGSCRESAEAGAKSASSPAPALLSSNAAHYRKPEAGGRRIGDNNDEDNETSQASSPETPLMITNETLDMCRFIDDEPEEEPVGGGGDPLGSALSGSAGDNGKGIEMVEEEGADQDQEEDQDEDDCSTRTIVKLEDAAGCQLERGAREASSRPEVGNDAVLGQFPLANQAKTCSAMLSSAGQPVQEEGAGCSGGSEQHGQAAIDLSSTTMATASAVLFVSTLSATKCQRTTCHHHHHRSRRQTTRWLSCCRSRGAQCCSAYLTAATSSQQLTQSSALAPVTGTGAPGGRSNLAAQLAAVKDEDAELDKKQSTLATTTITGWPARLVPNREDKPNRNEQQLEQQQQVSSNKVGTLAANWAEHLFPPTPRQALCLDCQRGADDGAASASSMVSHSSCWNCGRQCCWPTSWWPQTDDTVTPATSALLRPTTPGQQFHKVALEMAGTTDLVTTSTTSSGQHNSDTTRLQQQLNVVQVQSPGFVAAAALTTKGKQANGCIQADQNYFLLVSERRRLAQLNQRAANNNNDNHKLNNNNNHTDYRRPTTRPDQVCICLEATVTSGGGDPLATSSFGSARPAAPAAAQGLRQQHNCQDKRQSSLSPAPLEDTPQLGETRARDKEDNSESGTDNGIAATGRGARPPAPSNKSEPNERSNSSNNNSNNNKPSEVSSKSRQPAIASIASDFSGSGLLALGGSAPKSLLCFQPNRHWSQQQHAILSQHEQLSSAVAAEAAIDDGDKLVRSLGETGAANGTRRGPVLGGASSCGEPNRNRYDCQDHDDGQKEDNDDEVLLADPKLGSRARDSGRPSLGCAERDDHMSLGQEAGAVSIQSRARQNNEQQRYKQHQELAGRKGTEIQEHELRIISFISHETNGGGMGSRSNDNNNNDKTENNNGELAASSVRHDLRFAAKRSRVLCSNCALTLASLQRQRHHNQHYNNSSSHELVKGCAMTQSWRPLVTTGRGAPASEEDQSQQRTTELGLQRLRRNDHDEQNHQLNLSTTRQCTSTTATSTTTSTSTTTTSAYSNNNGTTNNERIAPASLAGPNGLDNQSSGWDGHVRFSCMATSSTSSYSATATSCGTSETHNRMEAEAAIACGARRLDAADDDDGGIDLGAPVAILEGNQQAEDGPVKSNLWSEHHEPGAKLALASGDAGGDPLAGCTIVCTICQSEFVRSSRRNRRRQLKHKHHHQHHHHHHNHHHHHDQHNHHHHHHQRSQHHHPHHHHHHHHQHRTHHHHHQPQQQHLQQQHNHNYHHHQHSHNHNHSHHHHHHHQNHGPCLQQHNNSTVSFRNKRSSSLKHRNNNQQAQRSPLDHHKLFELKSILMSNHRHHVQLKTTRTTTRSPTVLNSTKGNRCGCDGTIPYTVPVYAIEAVTGFGPGSERLPAPPSSSVVVVVERRNGSHINMHTTECCNPTGGDSVRFVNQSNEQKQSSENYDDNSTTQSSRSMPTTTTNATTTAASSIVTIKLNSIERNDDDPGPARLALIAPQCDQSCAKSSPGGEPQTLTRTTILAHDKSCVNAADNNNDNTENNHNKSDESQSLASTKQALVVADSNSPPHRGVQSSSSHTEQTGQLACQEPTSGQVVVSGCSSPPPPPPTEAADDSQRRRATSSNLLVSRINANSSSTKSTSGSSLTTADTNHHQHETGGGGIGGGVVDTRGSNAHSMNARDTASAGANNYNNNPPDDTQMIRYLGSSNQVRSEQKATKVLGVVFFTFVICWSPFFIINFIQGFVGRDQLSKWISDEMLTTFLWLGYISSTINPVIYTVFNRNFRRAFRRLLLCREPVGRRPYRQSRSSDYYKSFRFSVNQHHNHHRHHHHQANQFVGGGGGANNFKLANNNNISGNRLRSGGHQGNNIRSGDGKRSRSGGSSSHKMLMLDESRALTGGFSNREMDATSMGGVTSQQQQHQQQQARSPSKSSLNVTATHLRQSFGLALRTALRNSTKLILPTSTSSSAANSTRSACEQNQDQDYHHHRQQQQQQQPSMMLSRCSTSAVNVD